MPRSTVRAAAAAGILLLTAGAGLADRIKHPTAVFAGLDKITGRIIAFEVGINETVQFGSLQLTPRICYSRPAYEAPQTDTFVEVEEVATNNEYKRIFTGWMFAASPGLNAVEHPVYDLWLTECKGGSEIQKVAIEKEEPVEVMPLQNRPPPKPATAVSERKPQGPKAAPTQSFFPTNEPPAAVGARPSRPLNISPVAIDPAARSN